VISPECIAPKGAIEKVGYGQGYNVMVVRAAAAYIVRLSRGEELWLALRRTKGVILELLQEFARGPPIRSRVRARICVRFAALIVGRGIEPGTLSQHIAALTTQPSATTCPHVQ
jgi:hypothetical protein